ncbi:MAG: sigma-70 family RNA polymerase sigma factor [Verrucomicrobiae bacterium]|nr:sigma-70 family RNA polymerase sigma factor [Verrucomicrobiae bacterium]
MDESELALTTLLARARARDPAAAEELVSVLYPVVMAVVERRRPRSVEAEDIAQEVFLRMFCHLDKFRGGPRELEAWLRRTAFRVCLDHHRYLESRPEIRWVDLTEEQRNALDAIYRGNGNPTPAEVACARDLVNALLSGLTAAERSLVEMVQLEKLDMEKVQQITGWSMVNIRVRMFRARRKLRRMLAKLLSDHESA